MKARWSELIKRYDKSDYFGKLLGFPEQCREGWLIGKKFSFRKPSGIEKIFVTGMGGSGYVGELLQKLFFQSAGAPVFVEHGYVLPKFVDGKTLAIVVSYSGNTEETVSVFKELKARGTKTVCVTSNGYLGKAASDCIVVPKGFQPRQATGFLFFSTLAALHSLGLSPFKERDFRETVALMERDQQALLQRAKKLAVILHGKMPVVYATESLQVSALRWQTELNEIAKVFCHTNFFPELQHNEINASLSIAKTRFVLLKTRSESKRMLARLSYSKKRIRALGLKFTEFEAKGKSVLSQVWHANYLGSLTAFYLAMLNRVDPTPVTLIEEMKAYLKRKV